MYVQGHRNLKYSSQIFFKVALLIIVLFKTSQLWGFSISRTEGYINAAKENKIWQNPQWIKLGHYEKKLWGGYTSIYNQGFFLDDNGQNSPELELLTTIRALYSESEVLTRTLQRHPQCHYLARAKWLSQHLNISSEDLIPCEERVNWKKQINASAVSIIFAASDFGNASSSFGHTFLKLINSENAKNKDLIDYGVDYSAMTDTSPNLFYAVKGLLGMYKGRFAMLPYHQKLRDYINLDGRDIWEYQLQFTPEEVDFLIDHLLELEHARAPYFFFTQNCSYQILKVLEVVRPNVDLAETFKYFVIPIDTVKKIYSETDWISNIKFKKSLKTDYLQSYSDLENLQKKALDEVVRQLNMPADYELTSKQKAQVYETAIKYFAVSSYRSGINSEEQQYKLSSERALLGAVTNEVKIKKIEPPHESHDSSALYLQSGILNSRSQKKSYYSFKFRNALHDLEQIDFGTVPMSQNEMGTIEFIHYEDDKKIQFEQLTLISLINLNSVTQLDKNLSWKLNLAVQKKWQSEISVSGGLSFSSLLLQESRLAYFLTGRSWYDDDRYLQGIGPEIMYMFRPTNSIGWSFSANYLLMNHKNDHLNLNSKLNINLSRKFDLQMLAENSYYENIKFQLGFAYNFLL